MPPRGLITLLLYAWVAGALAADQPARLMDGEHSIESLLRIPRSIKPGRYMVYCEAAIGWTGRAHEVYCYAGEGVPKTLTRAVATAGKRARFVPATRDGTPTDVYMMLMARIDVTSGDPLILVVPNNGVEAEQYGLFYTAPQRFNEFGGGWGSRHFEGRDVWMLERLRIDEHGKVVSFVVTNPFGAPQWMVDEVIEGIKKKEFMPGLFEGKPVPMDYIEPAFSRPD